MLSIFAIDPGVCQNVEWFRYCTEHCQPPLGRAIADLPPGMWLRTALDYINTLVRDRELGSVKGQSLKRRLDRVRDRLVDRPQTDWDYMEDRWLANAEREHRREPFAAVVSPEYDGADATDHKYHPGELNEDLDAWNTPNGVDITRTRTEFTAAILPMLLVAKEIHFLDRGFSVDANSLYTRNYQQLLRGLARCDRFPSITIHCCPDSAVDTTYFQGELTRHYAELVPARSVLTCVIWQVNGTIERGAHPFHNRFVISDRCGVLVGYGTDSANAATDAPDTLQLIDAKVFATKLKYSRKRTHPLISVRVEIQINGTG